MGPWFVGLSALRGGLSPQPVFTRVMKDAWSSASRIRLKIIYSQKEKKWCIFIPIVVCHKKITVYNDFRRKVTLYIFCDVPFFFLFPEKNI